MHQPQRQRQSASKSSITSQSIPDHEWSRLLVRRQNCKQCFQKIQNDIEDATNKIKQIEQNKRARNAEFPQKISSPTLDVLGTVNNSRIKRSLDCPDKTTVTRDFRMTASKLKPDQDIKRDVIPFRLVTLARQQNNHNSSRIKYEGSSSISSNCSTSSSTSLKYCGDVSYPSSGSQSVSSTSSSSTPLRSKDDVGKYFNDLNRNITEARQFFNQPFSLGKDTAFNKGYERRNVECVEKQANKNILENDTSSMKRTSLISNLDIHQDYNLPSYNEAFRALQKTIPTSCRDDLYDPKRPDFNCSSESNTFLSQLNSVQLSKSHNRFNASFNPISDTDTNKNIMQKHSYNFCGHVKTTEINNRKTTIQDKDVEDQQYFTHSQQNKQDVRTNARNIEQTEFNITQDSSSTCTSNNNPKYSLSCTERLLGQVSVNNSKADSNGKSAMSESIAHPRQYLQFPDYEIDRTFRDEYNSFHVRNPCEQRAKIILSPFHPVSNICDTRKSIFYCENYFSYFDFDQNNNSIELSVTYHQPDPSNMASHIVTTQNFATLCEDNENTKDSLPSNATKQLQKEYEKGLTSNKRKELIANGNSAELLNTSHSNGFFSPLTLNTSTISIINCGKKDLQSKAHSTKNNTDNSTPLSANDMAKNGAIHKGYDTNFTRDSSSYEKHNTSFSRNSSPFSDDTCSEWEYYSDEECYSPEGNLENAANVNRSYGMPGSLASHLSSQSMHNRMSNKKDKGVSDPWSPYLTDITFDITPNRNFKIEKEINRLKEWIEQISDSKNLDALKALNNDYHQLYPLCTVDKQIGTTVMDSNGETKEIACLEETKEGMHKEYIKSFFT